MIERPQKKSLLGLKWPKASRTKWTTRPCSSAFAYPASPVGKNRASKIVERPLEDASQYIQGVKITW